MNDYVLSDTRTRLLAYCHCFAFFIFSVLEFIGGSGCGPVSLFGGHDKDTFRIGAFATIQDYEAHDTIKLPAGTSDRLSTTVANGVTTVYADGVAVVAVDGNWQLGDLDIDVAPF